MEQETHKTATEDLVKGYTPLNLDECQNLGPISADYEIDQPMGDMICAEYIDENAYGEINRGGIWIKQEAGTKTWRYAKILKTGPLVSKQLQEGVVVMFPNDKGIPMVSFGGKKIVFLNESRLFTTVKLIQKT